MMIYLLGFLLVYFGTIIIVYAVISILELVSVNRFDDKTYYRLIKLNSRMRTLENKIEKIKWNKK